MQQESQHAPSHLHSSPGVHSPPGAGGLLQPRLECATAVISPNDGGLRGEPGGCSLSPVLPSHLVPLHAQARAQQALAVLLPAGHRLCPGPAKCGRLAWPWPAVAEVRDHKSQGLILRGVTGQGRPQHQEEAFPGWPRRLHLPALASCFNGPRERASSGVCSGSCTPPRAAVGGASPGLGERQKEDPSHGGSYPPGL